MKKLFIIVICLFFTFACASQSSNRQKPGVEHGASSALIGLKNLVLSPFQIAAGLLEGIASLPYYLSGGVHEINKGFIKAQAQITLDDTYESAYGKRLSQVPGSGETGEVFRRMKHATNYFQKVLKSHGVHDAQRYFLTSIDTASSNGYTLFAVVRRDFDSISVRDKSDNSLIRDFHKSDRLFYEPFRHDVNENSLDTIIDWAGIPKEYIETQKAQAIFITMAANSVLNAKRSNDYWQVEKRWIAGDYKEVTEQKMSRVRSKMNL